MTKKMLIECNKCKQCFEKQEIVFEKTIEVIGGKKCQMDSFKCPHCGETYPVFILAFEDISIYEEYQKLRKWLKKYQTKGKVKQKKWNNKFKKYKSIEEVLTSKHKILSETYKDNK